MKRLLLVFQILKNPARKMSVDIGGMRKPYHDKSDYFDFKDLVAREPFDQFKAWFEDASKHEKIYEANAMCLSTATSDGIPSSRMVLLKKYGPEGFTFYTNYTSRKAGELDSNPRAALTFYWEPLQRSIRVEGKVMRVGEEESLAYFHSRPISSQIGACVSNQSKVGNTSRPTFSSLIANLQVIGTRSVLTDKEEELLSKYGNGEEPVPKPDWGGYRVVPHMVEFWQGQSTRIHDRIRFRKLKEGEEMDEKMMQKGENGWVIERLAP